MVTIKRDRYIVYKIFSEKKCLLSDIKSIIWRTYQQLYGLVGSSDAGLYFEVFEEDKQMGLIRCTHTSLQNLLSVLSIISKCQDVELIIYPIYVTGLIKKAKKILNDDQNIDY
ncbi:MAG: Rpp14/Pop5 family protein [Candidatus Heimdallarchaeaceae archaeon]